MSVWIWVMVALLVVAVLMVVVARRAVGGVDPTQLLLDPELVGRVRALARANQKIPAIKMLRDGTPGLGLASAKQMVDRMAVPPVQSVPPIPPAPQVSASSPGDFGQTGTEPAGPDPMKHQPVGPDTGTPVETTPSASTVSLEVELQARSMKASGQPVSAIKLVREHTSWGLRQAKDYVDGL